MMLEIQKEHVPALIALYVEFDIPTEGLFEDWDKFDEFCEEFNQRNGTGYNRRKIQSSLKYLRKNPKNGIARLPRLRRGQLVKLGP